jgi:hypothetical protein
LSGYGTHGALGGPVASWIAERSEGAAPPLGASPSLVGRFLKASQAVKPCRRWRLAKGLGTLELRGGYLIAVDKRSWTIVFAVMLVGCILWGAGIAWGIALLLGTII